MEKPNCTFKGNCQYKNKSNECTYILKCDYKSNNEWHKKSWIKIENEYNEYYKDFQTNPSPILSEREDMMTRFEWLAKHYNVPNPVKEMSKKTERFFIMWTLFCYILFQVIFFRSWYFYSTILAISNQSVIGRPQEEIGILFGIFPAFITLGLCKVFIYDKIIIMKRNGCSPKI